MTHRSTTLALAALLAAMMPSFAPVLAQQDRPPAPPTGDQTYTLQAKYSPNDLLKYALDMRMNMAMKPEKSDTALFNMKMTGGGNMRMKTVAVKPDGTGVVVIQMQGMTMKMEGGPAGGGSMPVPETPPITEEVDRYGRLVTIRGLENLPGSAGLGSMMNFNRMPATGVVLPDHPVKVGDTWESDIPYPMSDQKAHVVSTLLGTEPVQGQETLKVKQLWKVPMQFNIGANGQPTKDASAAMMMMTGEFNMNNVVNILPANARLVKSISDIAGKMNMTMKGQAAQQSPMGGTMTMDLTGQVMMTLTSAGKVAPPAAKGK